MRVADYIAGRIAGLGVAHAFMVTGGGAMHLDDALGRREDVELVFCHHEQACAIAAEGYARVRGEIGIVCVTTGPGGTNAITGVLGQWHDSVPALYLSGQVRRDTTVACTPLPLRQLGDQEADIVRLVSPITKYAVALTDPETVRYHFEKAVWLATHGRPGPVWLDVPMDVQSAPIEPEGLVGFDPAEMRHQGGSSGPATKVASPAEDLSTPLETGDAGERTRRETGRRLRPWPPVQVASQAPGAFCGRFSQTAARAAARETLRRLRAARRPVVLAGSAVRGAGAHAAFLRVVGGLGAPVCTAWNAHDLLWESHPLYAGRPGTIGDRSGNFALQNADVVLSLGCRLNVRQVGYESRAFAHHAFRIVVDVDEAELDKPTIFPSLAVHSDVGFFVEELERELRTADHVGGSSAADGDGAGHAAPRGRAAQGLAHREWVAWCRERRRRYPAVLPEYRRREEPVNAYVFADELAHRLAEDDVVVCANGAACVVTLQAFAVKRGQRLIVNSGTAGMGYDLPAAVGAAFALRAGGPLPPARVICLAGDGSIQMNLQELQTIAHHQLPIKVFVFDNGGYLSIRQTQDNLCGGRRVGEGPTTGVSFPDLVRVADAYGIPAVRVTRHDELDEVIGAALVSAGPALVDVVMDPEQLFAPKVVAEKKADGRLVSKPLEDMYPFLSREELAENMIVPLYTPGET
jgi:acetolactate synthase I/II/III large subunit